MDNTVSVEAQENVSKLNNSPQRWTPDHSSQIAKQKNCTEDEYEMATVRFSKNGKGYDYLCDGKKVKVGDKVYVEVEGQVKRVEVIDVKIKKKDELDLPIESYKPLLHYIYYNLEESTNVSSKTEKKTVTTDNTQGARGMSEKSIIDHLLGTEEERRRQQQEENKRMTATQAIGVLILWFAALHIMLQFFDPSVKGILISLLLTSLGAAVLVYRTVTIRTRNKYVMLVNQGSSNTSIDWLASMMPTTFDKSAKELQKMIDMGYFGEAYIDYANRMIVLDKDEYRAKLASETEEISRSLEDETPIEVLNPVLDAKYKIVRGKYELLKLDETKKKETDRIGRLYINRMDEILEKCNATLNDSELVDKINALLDRMIDMLDTNASAFSESRKLDIETDIEALYNKLLADGYSGSEQNIF